MIRGQALLLLLISLCCQPAAFADDWQYTLRPGDDLWTIARDYCGSGNLAQAIADHNGVGDVSALRAGQRLAIPTAWLVFAPATATVIEASADARILRSAPAGTSVPARAGDLLDMGDRIVTGEGGVLVEFADTSQLAVQPNSEVLFNKLTAFGPAGMVDTHLRFAYGRGSARVQPQSRGDRFRIQTPQGIAAVRGTEFRVGHRRDDNASNSETLEGLVAFLQSNQSTELPAGFGVAASAQGVIKETLLDAPQWVDQNPTTSEQATVRWQAVPGAETYVVSWAQGNAPDIIVSEFITTTNSATVTVPPGDYRLGVRGVSGNNIEGYDAYRMLGVKNLPPVLQPVDARLAGRVEFAWQHAQPGDTFELTLDADHFDNPQIISVENSSHSTSLAAGNYRWRVQASDSAASAVQAFTLTPSAPQNLRVKRRDKTLMLRWEADDLTATHRIRLRRVDDGTIIEETATGTSIEITVPRYGEYQLELASLENSLQSETLSYTVQVFKRPWWMSLLIPLIAL